MPIGKWLASLFSRSAMAQTTGAERRNETAPKRHRDADVILALCQVISRGDAELMAEVAASVSDPANYYQVHGKNNPYFKSAADVDPLYAGHHALSRRGYLGSIDHAALTEELIEALTPLIQANGVDRFDWSFAEAVEEKGDYEANQNGNMLNIIAARLKPHGLTLASINMGWDQYDFAVLTRDAYSQVAGLRGRDFSIEDRFD